ncbi:MULTISPECIES: hypothetical protein [Serratia]|uniref:hypothetical protein n=1 Tax=Serratia TaxID=613 RepID=UPI002DB963F8|nr:hypothetical protein [Serratia ureilytica]MEB7893203.1 hypothetical protein [Serratia ureilytica]
MDYKKSLLAGLEAAHAARKSKDEIAKVIKTLSQAIEEVSNGEIYLEITKEKELSPKFSSMSTALLNLIGEDPYIYYNALSLIKKPVDKTDTTTNLQKRSIARWKMDKQDGYPCVISYDKQDVSCSTKDTLEKALMELMSTAQTGEKLLELKNH